MVASTPVVADTLFGSISTTGSGTAVLQLNGTDVAFARSLPTTQAGVVVDSAGDMFLSGVIVNTTVHLPRSGGGADFVLTDPTGNGADFVAKLSKTDGGALWATTLLTGGTSQVRSVATRGTDVAVLYTFGGTLKYLDSTAKQVTVSGAGPYNSDQDVLAAFVDGGNGRVVWAKHLHGAGDERANSIALDDARNVYVTGFTASASLTVDSEATPALPNPGPAAFAIKFNGTGVHGTSYAKSFPSTANINSVATTAGGEAFICGSFTTDLDLGKGTMTSKGQADAFVARLASDGSPQWSQSFGGSLAESCQSVSSDTAGNLVLGGTYASSGIVFGTHTFPDPTAGQVASSIIKLSGAGSILWAYDLVGTGLTQLQSVTTSSANEVYYSGAFTGSLDPGGGSVASFNGGLGRSLFVVRRAN